MDLKSLNIRQLYLLLVTDPHEEVCPKDMQQLKCSQKGVEYVVGGEHLDEAGSIVKCGVEDPGRVDSTTGDDPG